VRNAPFVHTGASLMIQAGYPPKMAARDHGPRHHHQVLDLYGLYPGGMDRYADHLDGVAIAYKVELAADAGRVGLKAVIGRVNAYTTKAIPHRDDAIAREGPAALAVTWGELDAALDALGNIHKKYYRLCHPGEALGGLTPLISPGWMEMFRTAWMPASFTPPRAMDCGTRGSPESVDTLI
jgi:hypothetical protein